MIVSPEEVPEEPPDEPDWGTAVGGAGADSVPPPQAARINEATMIRPIEIKR